MPKPLLSIVIQTKNEECYLPSLLDSIKKQNFRGEYELIVADAGSTDSTRKIAKTFGCRVINGGKKHAEGINEGAKAAKSEIILFLDADTVLPQNFLMSNYSEFIKKQLDLATCCASPMSKHPIDLLVQELANLSVITKIKLYIFGFCFMITKKKFFELGGFDESVAWFDDLAFSNKLPPKIKFAKLPVRVKVSVRRREKIGMKNFIITLLLLTVHRLLKKNYRGHYNS